MNIASRLLVLDHHKAINFVLELSTEEKIQFNRIKNHLRNTKLFILELKL